MIAWRWVVAALLVGGLLGYYGGQAMLDRKARDWKAEADSTRVAHAAENRALRARADSALAALDRIATRPQLPPQSRTPRVDTLEVPAYVDAASVHAWRSYALAQKARADEAEDARVQAWLGYERERAAADSAVAAGRQLAGVLAARDSQLVALQRLVRTAPVGRRAQGGLALEVLADAAGGLEVAGTAVVPITARVALIARASAGPEGQTVRAGARVAL